MRHANAKAVKDMKRKLGPLGRGLSVDHLSRRQSLSALPQLPAAHFHGVLSKSTIIQL